MRNLLSLLSSGGLLLLSSDAVAAGTEFVKVSLAERETVSGKGLMITAYGVIFGLMVLYVGSLIRRQRAVAREAAELSERIGSSPDTEPSE